jgi:hypothetical protein
MRYARIRIASSVIATSPAAGGCCSAFAPVLRPAEALRGVALRFLPTDFARPVDFAGAFFASAGFADPAVTKPLLDSIPGAVEVPSWAEASFDFFELFAIYFCFGSAKPVRAKRGCASGKGTKRALAAIRQA